MEDFAEFGNYYAVIAGYLIFFALFICGLLFFRKYLLRRMSGGGRGFGMGTGTGSYMKIRDRLVIAPDKQIILLEIKNKVMMIGVSAHSMSALGEFEKTEFGADTDINTDGADAARKDAGFLGALSEKIKTGFDNFGNKKD
jgi:flagellar biogenesis protein FliO